MLALRYNPQTTKDSEVGHARKSEDCCTSLIEEGVRPERVFQVLDIYCLRLKMFASTQYHTSVVSLVPSMLLSCRYIITRTHTPRNKKAQPFPDFLHARTEQEWAEPCIKEPTDLLLLALGTAGVGSLGSHSLSPPPKRVVCTGFKCEERKLGK